MRSNIIQTILTERLCQDRTKRVDQEVRNMLATAEGYKNKKQALKSTKQLSTQEHYFGIRTVSH